jgi:sortase A
VIANNRIGSRYARPRALFLHAAFCFFLAAGVLGLGYAAYVVIDARAYEAIEEFKLPAMQPAPGPRIVAEGEVIGEMNIPRIELKTIVVQGDTNKILRRSVGHIPKTPLPGEPGNVALAGHRDGFFRPLRNIQTGDAITIQTPGVEYQYQVESTEIVLPTDVQVLQSTNQNTLTLVTCYPFYYIGSAPKRFIVRARQIGLLQTHSSTNESPRHF